MKHEWLLKRNCSLSPRQAAYAYGLPALFVLGLHAGFALAGIWYALVYAVIELGGVALALLHYARHATDREHIALSAGCLLVERIEAGQLCQVRLDPCWTRIALPDRRRSLIRLESRGVKVDVGGFVSEEIRQRVAQELRRELRTSSYLA